MTDTEKLIDGILNVEPHKWDNPNGGYEITCPFCIESVETKSSYGSMYDIEHEPNCVFELAYKLNKK